MRGACEEVRSTAARSPGLTSESLCRASVTAMPSLEHEELVELFSRDPALALLLASSSGQLTLPAYDSLVAKLVDTPVRGFVYEGGVGDPAGGSPMPLPRHAAPAVKVSASFCSRRWGPPSWERP